MDLEKRIKVKVSVLEPDNIPLKIEAPWPPIFTPSKPQPFVCFSPTLSSLLPFIPPRLSPFFKGDEEREL